MADDESPQRERVPDVSLPTLEGDATVPLRARRTGTVLVLLAAAEATPPREVDAAWLQLLAANVEALREWDGRVVVVLDGESQRTVPALSSSLDVVADAQRRVARATGLDAPALVIADQWGEVHAALPARDAWPPLEEVVSWLRYMAIRCAG